jgi:uridine kinase
VTEGRAEHFPPGKPLVVGVAGGSGSGKTTVVRETVRRLEPRKVVVIRHDSYYRDLSHLAPEARDRANFDHPDALETPLLVEHLRALLRGEAVDVPVYDFATHTRERGTVRTQPSGVILLDGILLLAEPELRAFMDIKVYVDTDPGVRFIRRLERDLKERGRSVASVARQYVETVRPMHLEFVEPSKSHADIIIPGEADHRVAVDLLATRLSSAPAPGSLS